ncbi:MAG: nucleotidyltransferase family protein [Ardenticatenaceae bacterium]|nr:nucleotidyltransferase family protein [Ardenticatenaceae bacterium]
MLAQNIFIPEEAIKAFCQRHKIINLAFFGSILGPDFKPESDVDVLVEFESGHIPGFEFFSMQDELTEILGRPVELHTPNFLSPHFRENVIKEAQVLYVTS